MVQCNAIVNVNVKVKVNVTITSRLIQTELPLTWCLVSTQRYNHDPLVNTIVHEASCRMSCSRRPNSVPLARCVRKQLAEVVVIRWHHPRCTRIHVVGPIDPTSPITCISNFAGIWFRDQIAIPVSRAGAASGARPTPTRLVQRDVTKFVISVTNRQIRTRGCLVTPRTTINHSISVAIEIIRFRLAILQLAAQTLTLASTTLVEHGITEFVLVTTLVALIASGPSITPIFAIVNTISVTIVLGGLAFLNVAPATVRQSCIPEFVTVLAHASVLAPGFPEIPLPAIILPIAIAIVLGIVLQCRCTAIQAHRIGDVVDSKYQGRQGSLPTHFGMKI